SARAPLKALKLWRRRVYLGLENEVSNGESSAWRGSLAAVRGKAAVKTGGFGKLGGRRIGGVER
ncbi:MAG: hypothetical protein IKK39_08380, partial [Thermoguttaceae bacterium]|nr:hypothetical protein [Thermoguttaceae bacterium]